MWYIIEARYMLIQRVEYFDNAVAELERTDPSRQEEHRKREGDVCCASRLLAYELSDDLLFSCGHVSDDMLNRCLGLFDRAVNALRTDSVLSNVSARRSEVLDAATEAQEAQRQENLACESLREELSRQRATSGISEQ
jgi:hypothetical protein